MFKNLASFPGLPQFYLPFMFTIMHGSGGPAKNEEGWDHSSCEWTRGGRRGEGPIFKYVRTKRESEFLTVKTSFDYPSPKLR